MEKGHVHALAMIAYGMDALKTNEPWERWEFAGPLTGWEWEKLINNPLWAATCNYQHKGSGFISKGE